MDQLHSHSMLSDRSTERGGGRQGLLPQDPQPFLEKGPKGLFILFLLFWIASSRCFFFFHFPLHCLDSVCERLGRIISNTFMVSVDKYFDTCKHVEPTLLIN